MMKFTPRNFQQLAIQHLTTKPHANLFAKPGSGKTVITLTSLVLLDLLADDVFPALIFAPLRVARGVWAQEIEKWAHTRHLRVVSILGNRTQRQAALAQEADIYLINYDNACWLESLWISGRTPKFKTLVADESSKLKGARTQIRKTEKGMGFRRGGTRNATSVIRMGLGAHRRYNLTGTPSANGLEGLWAQQFFLDHGKALGPSFHAFKSRWFSEYGNYGASKIKPHAHSFDEITKLMKPVTLSIDPGDYMDLGEPRVVDIEVTLPETLMKKYKELKTQMVVDIGSKTITAVNAGVLVGKTLAYASGFLYHAEEAEEWTYIHDEKLQALDDILEELQRPVVVVYHYRAERERLLKRYPQAVALPADAAKQTSVINDWNSCKVPILLIQPQSAGHGVNLQHGGSDMVVLNPQYDLELYQQVIERIGPTRQKQSGYDRQVSIYRIVTKNTVDMEILKVLDKKATLQEAVMATMK